jgi:hypothetical protein
MMRACSLPSLATLEANDDDRLAAELRLVRLRTQAAIVRTLSDHVERFAQPADADALSVQLIEEVAKMGQRLSEAAASLTPPRSRESGIFQRLGSVVPAFASPSPEYAPSASEGVDP